MNRHKYIFFIRQLKDPEKLQAYLNKLNRKQRKIISHRFELDGKRFKTLDELAKILGLTRERVRQIQMKSVRMLRAMLQKRSDFFSMSVRTLNFLRHMGIRNEHGLKDADIHLLLMTKGCGGKTYNEIRSYMKSKGLPYKDSGRSFRWLCEPCREIIRENLGL